MRVVCRRFTVQLSSESSKSDTNRKLVSAIIQLHVTKSTLNSVSQVSIIAELHID
jgi:P2-related tail formation protein